MRSRQLQTAASVIEPTWYECRSRVSGEELIELHRINPDAYFAGYGAMKTLCGKAISAAFVAEGRRRHEAAKCIVCEKS